MFPFPITAPLIFPKAHDTILRHVGCLTSQSVTITTVVLTWTCHSWIETMGCLDMSCIWGIKFFIICKCSCCLLPNSLLMTHSPCLWKVSNLDRAWGVTSDKHTYSKLVVITRKLQNSELWLSHFITSYCPDVSKGLKNVYNQRSNHCFTDWLSDPLVIMLWMIYILHKSHM